MGILCQILLDKAEEGVHRAGSAVTGKVSFVVDEPTEYQDVTLSLVGKGKCVWRTGGKNNTTHRGTEEYITTIVNVFDKKPEDTITLEGKYEHPFEFFLPEDIPRSYVDYIGFIRYRIQLKFEKPSFFSFNKVFTAEIPVYSYLNPTSEGPVIFGLNKELFALFASQTPIIKLKAKIEKTTLSPGENAHISYIVTNDSDVEIISVKTDLHCYTTYTSDYEAKKQVVTKIELCEEESGSMPAWQVSRFSCVLPTRPELYSIPNSKVICVEYRVRATLRLPLPHFNATVEQPVLIGEQRGGAERVLEAPADPPSYWAAMDEGKHKDESDYDSE